MREERERERERERCRERERKKEKEKEKERKREREKEIYIRRRRRMKCPPRTQNVRFSGHAGVCVMNNAAATTTSYRVNKHTNKQ